MMLIRLIGMFFRPWLIAICTPALIFVPQIFREIGEQPLCGPGRHQSLFSREVKRGL